MNGRIEINPSICHGKPVIKGTRVPVSLVLAVLAAGDSVEVLQEDYPNLTPEDVSAALAHASELANFEEHAYTAVAS